MTTLLLADDSTTMHRVIALTFANEPIRVVTAATGEAGLAMVAAEQPDIVLASVGLPDVDGYLLAEHVKSNPATSTTPVVLLGGAFAPIDEARARAIGCDGLLSAPVEPHQVFGMVMRLLSTRTTEPRASEDETLLDFDVLGDGDWDLPSTHAPDSADAGTAAPGAPPLSRPAAGEDAMLEDIVRRVATRLTGEVEHLVRQELERLKR